MKNKRAILIALVVFLVLVTSPVFSAVNTAEISEVRKKPVLDEKDFEIIDKFVGEAVQDLVRTRDFTSIADARRVILTCSKSTVAGQAQYAEQFSESAYKYISNALVAASGLPEERKFKVILNLLILVDGLEDLRLANVAMKMLNDENAVIRYWAVHSVTNPGIIKQLNSGDNSELASEIAERLKELVGGAGSEIAALMAEFAGEINVPQAEDLSLQIADMRIRKYADWAVKDELLDAAILELLYNRISSANVSKPAVARRFAQLYSYAMQRYIKGQDFLNAIQKHQLASVLVEIEQTCISKILVKSQSDIRRAVGRDDYTRVSLEYGKLFGNETAAGALTLKLNCDYGTKDDGSKRIAPLVLPEPPEPKVPEIKTED